MNKIIVNHEKYSFMKNKYQLSESKEYLIEVSNFHEELFITIPRGIHITVEVLAKNSDFSLHFVLEEESRCDFRLLLLEGSIQMDTKLEGENSVFDSNINMISKKDSNNHIQITHPKSHTVSNIVNHGFSLEKAKIIFSVDSSVWKEASKCISHQDNQIIENKNSMSKINPNLYIDNYDVEASHSAYIGEFKEEELFYLMSRGISKEDSCLLLLKAFLTNGFIKEKDKYIDNIMKYYSC